MKRTNLKSILLIVATLMVSALEPKAATIYVDAQLASASCANYSPANWACGGGQATAYRTIAAASAVAQPGDTVLIREGTYAEQFRPAASGGIGSPITYQAFNGETVIVGGGANSEFGMLLSDRMWLVIDGLQVQDRSWCESHNTHYTVMQNCIFLRTPATGTTGNVRFISSNFNQILNCTFLEGNDNLLLIDANYNLVQGCTIGTGRHSVLGIRCGDYNIIRSNYLYNPLQHAAEVYDCGEDTSAVPNSFNSTHHNVFEDNIFAQAELGGLHDTTSNGNGLQYSGQDGIIRRNIFVNCTVGLGIQVYGDEALSTVNNRIYNNVFAFNRGAGIHPSAASINNIYKNNVLYQNSGCIGGCEAAVSAGQVVYRTEAAPKPFGAGGLLENNDIFYKAPGDAVFEMEFAGGGQTVAQFNAQYPGVLLNTLEVDPFFENALTNNFRLRSTSPLIDAGAFLTRTLLPGAGLIIPVQDAFPFIDGFSISNEPGDVVQLQGQTETARVMQVDYVLNILLLDRPLIWSGNQGVALTYHGSAPDIGAFETSPTQASIESAIHNGTLTLTWPAGAGYHLAVAKDVEGPYTPVASADGSYSEPVSADLKFFELVKD